MNGICLLTGAKALEIENMDPMDYLSGTLSAKGSNLTGVIIDRFSETRKNMGGITLYDNRSGIAISNTALTNIVPHAALRFEHQYLRQGTVAFDVVQTQDRLNGTFWVGRWTASCGISGVVEITISPLYENLSVHRRSHHRAIPHGHSVV